jgi:pimeloyl-ACP methyl ester carboxylesterase
VVPIAGFDTARLRLDSGEILPYHDEGAGERVLLLLHGFNAHSGTWRKNTPTLSVGRRIIAPSLLPSRSLLSREAVERYTSQVRELLAFLNVGPTFSIGGNSMGGWIAMKLALIDPQSVDHLILEDTAGISLASDESTEILSVLDGTRIPTLIIWGRNDDLIPTSIAEKIHSSLQSSQLLMVEGAGHVPHWEQPRVFEQAVLRFLDVPR